MKTIVSTLACFATLVSAFSTPAQDWRSYAADGASTKYSPLNQIDASNVKNLKVAWRWTSPDEAIRKGNPDLKTFVNEATPLVVDGVLYTSTSMSQVAALDAATGKTLWIYDPKTYENGTPANIGFVHRGVSYWEDGQDHRIIYTTGDAYLIALNADTGRPIPSFGEEGRVDLTQGLRRPIDRSLYACSSPPVICRDVVVTGSTVLDAFAINQVPRRVMPPGDVRGFDVRTGKQKWVFKTIPQKGEFGNNTWEGDSAERTGSANVWTLMSFDEELGTVYLPVSTPTNDYYGGERKGDNLFAESLVCLDAETGQRVWHFQMIHHGLWDYDLPAAPNLIDITVNGRKIMAVAQISKQAFCYVFDRVTGEPVWPIEEQIVPQSQIPGERASPTQPIPSKPPPFDRQGLTDDDLIDFSPELRRTALEVVSNYDSGPLFTPATMRGVIQIPGLVGGASWAGAAVDPGAGIIYIPSYTNPAILTLKKAPDGSPFAYTGSYAWGPSGPDGLPILKPPYGRITAIDLNTGDHIWMAPVGQGPTDHPLLKDLDLPPLGWNRRVFPILTPTLIFAAQAGIAREAGISKWNNASLFDTEYHDAYLFAFDPKTGHQVARIEIPGNAFGAPMTYEVDGKQYIATPIGGGDQPAELIALSLP